MTRENGIMVLEIPNDFILDMTPPLNTEQLDQYSTQGMKELMSSMTPKEVRDLTIRSGVDPEDVPKRVKKEVFLKPTQLVASKSQLSTFSMPIWCVCVCICLFDFLK